MKLRVFQNNIRLRLNTMEVAGLAHGLSVEMRADLFPEPLIYQLACGREGESPLVTFQAGILRIALPASQLKEWASTDQVGIDVSLPTKAGQPPLNLLIEKDFKCLHGEVEDQADCFNNPLAVAD